MQTVYYCIFAYNEAVMCKSERYTYIGIYKSLHYKFHYIENNSQLYYIKYDSELKYISEDTIIYTSKNYKTHEQTEPVNVIELLNSIKVQIFYPDCDCDCCSDDYKTNDPYLRDVILYYKYDMYDIDVNEPVIVKYGKLINIHLK